MSNVARSAGNCGQKFWWSKVFRTKDRYHRDCQVAKIGRSKGRL